MNDPLKYFFNVYGFSPATIKSIHSGSIYTLVVLKSGQQAICGNVTGMQGMESKNITPDFNNLSHRIILCAYYNALLSPHFQTIPGDIFEKIDFSVYKNLTMIGYFRPLYQKMLNIHIKPNVFDLEATESEVLPIAEQKKYLQKSDSIIITSTTLANNTFSGIIANCPKSSHKFLLGPSGILSPELKYMAGIKNVFSSTFSPNDIEVEQLVSSGFGAREILKRGKKVML